MPKHPLHPESEREFLFEHRGSPLIEWAVQIKCPSFGTLCLFIYFLLVEPRVLRLPLLLLLSHRDRAPPAHCCSVLLLLHSVALQAPPLRRPHLHVAENPGRTLVAFIEQRVKRGPADSVNAVRVLLP